VFADFSPAANIGNAESGQSAPGSTADHGSNTGKRFTRAPIRPDQFAFRRALFERFNDRCALTGCAIAQLLDAAHLPGRDWSLGQNSAEDGILLRADLHRAMDNDLIRLDENLHLVWVHESVRDLYRHLLSGRDDSALLDSLAK
jgi:hypothetical protein